MASSNDGGFIGQLISSVLGLNLFGSDSKSEDTSVTISHSRETRQAQRSDLYGAASGGGLVIKAFCFVVVKYIFSFFS
jgi:hypothetical protein